MADTHVIVLPGGGYAEHAPHEAEPVARWLAGTGVNATVFRYPLDVRHPVPLLALRAEISRLRAEGADRIGLMGFSAGGHLAGLAACSLHLSFSSKTNLPSSISFLACSNARLLSVTAIAHFSSFNLS